jgi:hypothetical protein
MSRSTVVSASIVLFLLTRSAGAAEEGRTSFVPIKTCRLLEARGESPLGAPFGGPRLEGGETRTFDLGGPLPPGNPCAGVIPAEARALTMTLVAFDANRPGLLSVDTDSVDPLPLAWYQARRPLAVSTTVNISDHRLVVRAEGGAVALLADVTGYYVDGEGRQGGHPVPSPKALDSITCGTGLSCSPNPLTGTGTIALATPVPFSSGGTGSTSSFSSGAIPFSTGSQLTQDTSNFSYDSSAHKLSVNNLTLLATGASGQASLVSAKTTPDMGASTPGPTITSSSNVYGAVSPTFAYRDIQSIVDFKPDSNYTQAASILGQVTSESTTAASESAAVLAFNYAKGTTSVQRVWGIDDEIFKLSSMGPAQNALMIGIEVGVTKDPAEPSNPNAGSYGAVITGGGASRDGYGLVVTGSAGWKYPIVVDDTDSDRFGTGAIGSTLFSVDQYGRVVVGGTNQATGTPSDSGLTGATVFVNDKGTAPNNGGEILFGTNGSRLAAIKAAVRDLTGNGVSDLVFSSRKGFTDTSFTENLRIQGPENQVLVSGNLKLNGSKLIMGSNNAGAATLSGSGTATVTAANASSTSTILLTYKGAGPFTTALTVTSQSSGSFTVAGAASAQFSYVVFN